MAKEKKYYRVKVEGYSPVILNYRVLADSPEEAIELTSRIDQSKMDCLPRPDLKKFKKNKSTAYEYGTITVRGQKTYNE